MEIGSEFHYMIQEEGKGVQLPKGIEDYVYSFSGRTAIEIILNNISIKKVMLPSYCCDSMIEPFRRANIEIEFYSVYYDQGLKVELNIRKDTDCILWCNYFGFSLEIPDIKYFLEQGGIVIEDITHSFFSRKSYHEESHYLVASLRKWEPILCGGLSFSKVNKLLYVPTEKPNTLFLEMKRNAMKLKKKYLEGEKNVSKQEYLQLFNESNKWLARNYSNYSIDKESLQYLVHVDSEKHRVQRIKNAKLLYDGLKKHSDIKFLFPVEKMECPLFVPVIIKNDIRAKIWRKLIENEIYCPIHWPRPKENCESNLYDIELSLVCDQRYNERDMKRIIDILNNK